jgi:hypothetical protein
MTQWQPIETAKHGKAIVFDSKIGVITGAFIFCHNEGKTIQYGFHNNRAYDVTHWMPEPEAPEEEGEKS